MSTHLEMDQEGDFMDKWPEGFFKREQMSFSKKIFMNMLLDAQCITKSFEQFKYIIEKFGFEKGRLD